MHTRTDATTSAVGKVVTVIGVCCVDVGGGGKVVIEVSFWYEVVRGSPVSWVVINRPIYRCKLVDDGCGKD